jgi:membrane dipeptidase
MCPQAFAVRGALLTAFVLAASCQSNDVENAIASSEKQCINASSIHDRILTIDSHVDVPRIFATPELDPGMDGNAQVDLPKMVKGGMDAAFFVAAVGQQRRTAENYARATSDALAMISGVRRMTNETYPDRIQLAYMSADVRRISSQGKLAAAIGIENAFAIGMDLSLIKRFHDLGVRYMSLTHIGHNDIADSSDPNRALGDDDTEHDGISSFGEDVIAEMNRLGMIIDVSHASKASMLDALSHSRAPVIASHSSVKSLVDVPRNLDDEQLLALKRTGGVIQVVAYSHYIKENPPEKADAIRRLAQSMGLAMHVDWAEASNARIAAYGTRLIELDQAWPRASVQNFVDHIDYAVELMGIDHVGIASDFYSGGGAPSGGLAGWMNAVETPQVTLELIRRGYCEEEIAKIWGGNLLRVWNEVEKVARESPQRSDWSR